MSTPPQPTHHEALAKAIEAYLLGTLSDEQINAFEADLLRHPDAADLCAEAMDAVAMTREVFRDDQEQRVILKHDETLEGFHGLLAELGEAETRAEAELVHIVGQIDGGRPFWQQWPFVIPSAIAALLAIAVILIVALPAATPPTITPGIVQTPNQSSPIASAKGTVATLTATHNATWAERASAPGSLTPGSKLHPNTRLTLTAGFAEITTNDGADVYQGWTLSIDTGSGTPASGSTGPFTAGPKIEASNVSSALAGLTGLTDTTVTFTIGIDNGVNTSFTSGSANNRRTVVDNITLTGTSVPVPEPSSLALLGLGGLCVLRRRRG